MTHAAKDDFQVVVLYSALFDYGLWKWLEENIGKQSKGWWAGAMSMQTQDVPLYIVDENDLIQFKLTFAEHIRPYERRTQ